MTTPVRRRRRPILAALPILALLGCGRAETPPETTPPAPVKWQEPRQVVLEEWTELVGSTEPLPEHAARVTAPVEGRVLSVLRGAAGKPVEEGQPVHAGDVLVRLDDTVTRAAREKAASAVNVLRSEGEAAAFTVKLADLEVRRLRQLQGQTGGGDRDLVSRIEREKADLALEAARAAMRSHDTKLQAAEEEVAALDRQLKLYTLTAPRDGRLGRLQVVSGQTLAIGAPVAEVLDIAEAIDVLCFVPASDLRRLQLGQPAHVGGIEKDPSAETTADPEGQVVFLSEQAEPETGHFAVKVRFPNKDLKLRANAVVRLRVLTRPGKSCWAVPVGALIEDQDPPVVVVAEGVETKKNSDGKEEEVGKARKLQAILGVRDRVLGLVEVLRLQDPDKKSTVELEGAKVIVEKGQGLQTGDDVRLEVEEDEEPAKPEEKPAEK